MFVFTWVCLFVGFLGYWTDFRFWTPRWIFCHDLLLDNMKEPSLQTASVHVVPPSHIRV